MDLRRAISLQSRWNENMSNRQKPQLESRDHPRELDDYLQPGEMETELLGISPHNLTQLDLAFQVFGNCQARI